MREVQQQTVAKFEEERRRLTAARSTMPSMRTELSSIPLKCEQKMGTIHIEVDTGLAFRREAASVIGAVVKIINRNGQPSELELRQAIARALRRDEYSLTDEDIWAALMREIDRRESAPAK